MTTVRILSMCKEKRNHACELVDVLRCLAMQGWDNVVGVNWQIEHLDIYLFGGNGGISPEIDKILFPELAEPVSSGPSIVSGERLMERSALISNMEECSLTRIPRTTALQPFLGGPTFSQFQSEDTLSLKIECSETPLEVTTNSQDIFGMLLSWFAHSEVVETSAGRD